MSSRTRAQVHVRLDLSAVPLLPGALDASVAGVASSLAPANSRAAAAVANAAPAARHAAWALILDPQTAGGLLAGVAAERAAACVAALRELGYGAAAVIGEVVAEAAAANGAVRHGREGLPPVIDMVGLSDEADRLAHQEHQETNGVRSSHKLHS